MRWGLSCYIKQNLPSRVNIKQTCRWICSICVLSRPQGGGAVQQQQFSSKVALYSLVRLLPRSEIPFQS